MDPTVSSKAAQSYNYFHERGDRVEKKQRESSNDPKENSTRSDARSTGESIDFFGN